MNNALKRGITQTPYFIRTKPVSNPSAQFGTLLQSSEQDLLNQKILQEIAAAGVNKFGVYSVGVDLMLSGGLRLSEILYPAAFFVTPLGQIAVHGRKKSADKLVSPIYQRGFWLQSQGWRANPFAFTSRWSWYRFFKAQGVCMSEKGRKNNIVTHSARKLQAHNLFNGGVELAGIRDIMGHRSESSTLYYRAERGV